MVLKVCFLIRKVQRDLIRNEVTTCTLEFPTTLLPAFHAPGGPTARQSLMGVLASRPPLHASVRRSRRLRSSIETPT